MDNFGKHISIPTAVGLCGLALVGYQLYRRNQNNDTETQRNSTGLTNQTASTLPSNTTLNDGQATTLNLSLHSQLSMDGGDSSYSSDGNENPYSSTPDTRQASTQSTRQSSAQTEAKKSRPKLSPETVNKIHGLESNFFKGLDQKANLNADELSRLDQIVTESNSSASYLEILHKMRQIGYFKMGYYKTPIMNSLQISNIVVNSSVLEHLDWFDENIQIIISEDLEKNKSKFQYDIVLVFSDDDHSKAVDFSLTIEQNLQSLDVKIASLSDMDGNQTELRSLENIFQCSMFVFVLISSNFKNDDLKRYICETSLTESLQNPKANWRVVPVWLEKDMKKNKKCPIELSPLKGINFHCVTENSCPYTVKSVMENIKSLIEKGRSEIEPA